MRGTARCEYPFCRSSGITPACAGNSEHLQACPARTPDHPRVCGEQPGKFMLGNINLGSPPRVRGTANFPREIDGLVRITPRVCGEQTPIAAPNYCVIGSPQRVRGTDRILLVVMLYERITPACAGNSAKQLNAVPIL